LNLIEYIVVYLTHKDPSLEAEVWRNNKVKVFLQLNKLTNVDFLHYFIRIEPLVEPKDTRNGREITNKQPRVGKQKPKSKTLKKEKIERKKERKKSNYKKYLK